MPRVSAEGASRARPVASVARAVALLEALAANPEGLGVVELARRLGVDASTASRLLATLERGRLVERSARGPYRLGIRLVALADGVLARLDVREAGRERLRELAAETSETATLSIPAGTEAVTVDFVPAESSIVSMARIGRSSAAHATATGKVMLAFGGPAAHPGELVAHTPRTIVHEAALRGEIEGVRARGWGESVGEREPDLNALAAPVFGRGGELAAIVGVQGPAARLDAARRRAVLPSVLATAAALTRTLGGEPR
jgi:DNA-binding IclR family transcriptional regulator